MAVSTVEVAEHRRSPVPATPDPRPRLFTEYTQARSQNPPCQPHRANDLQFLCRGGGGLGSQAAITSPHTRAWYAPSGRCSPGDPGGVRLRLHSLIGANGSRGRGPRRAGGRCPSDRCQLAGWTAYVLAICATYRRPRRRQRFETVHTAGQPSTPARGRSARRGDGYDASPLPRTHSGP